MQPFVAALAGSAAGGLWKTAVLTALFAAAGLGAGVALVLYARRRGLLRRDGRRWAWVARVHYAYVPLVLMLLGGSLGTVYGAHRVVRGAIDHGSASAQAYARGYLPALQAALNHKLNRPRGSELTVEALVAEQMQLDGVRNPLVRAAMYRLNLAIVHYALDQVQLPQGVEGAVTALRHVDLTDLEGRAYRSLPRALHGAANSYFAGQYLLVLMLFAPFLLLPGAEYAAHAVYRRRRPAAAPAS